MSNDWNRRELLVGLGAGLALAQGARAAATPPAATASSSPLRRLAPPYCVGSDNCLASKDAAGSTVLAAALEAMARGDRTLAAIVAALAIVELDPEDTSVGYGGLPNADGVVELDAAVMEGGSGRAGGVAALQGVRTPARVALEVADRTDHHLLVGAGAQAFARAVGFAIEDDLNTERSRKAWLDWKRRIDPSHWLDPERSSSLDGASSILTPPASDAAARLAAMDAARVAMMAEGRLAPQHAWGTIHLSAVGRAGDVACATTTSGLAFKIPGRVGDSPILGAGLFCLADVGSAGSTGRGEANLAHLSSAWIVDEMRRGAHPKDAAMAALSRIRATTRTATHAARLRTEAGEPAFNLQFYALDARGNAAGVSLYRAFRGNVANFAVGDRAGTELRECEGLLEAFEPPTAKS